MVGKARPDSVTAALAVFVVGQRPGFIAVIPEVLQGGYASPSLAMGHRQGLPVFTRFRQIPGGGRLSMLQGLDTKAAYGTLPVATPCHHVDFVAAGLHSNKKARHLSVPDTIGFSLWL